MSTEISAKPVVAQVAAAKPAITDNGKIKIGGAAISLIKPARK